MVRRARGRNRTAGMKLGDTKFFNLFALVAASTNSDRTRDRWRVGSVEWTRERTTHRSPDYSFHTEIHVLRQPGNRGWTLMLGHETWWDGDNAKPFRNGKWVHFVKGDRTAALKWFAEQEKEFD
jgi:hypothetical protein